MTRDLTRRAFLGRAALGAAGFGLAGCAFHEVVALTPGEVLPFITPVERHYVKNGAEGSIAGWSMPSLAAADWGLTIDGLVAEPATLSMADLDAASDQRVEVLKTIQCVVDSNSAQGLVANARWSGVPLRAFLDRAGIDRARARRLHLLGADGFRGNLPLEKVYEASMLSGLSEPLLVTHMNGAPLLRAHGGPVRLMVHDGLGYANVKWLVGVTATEDESAHGTYQDTGFTDESRAPVNSRFTAPTDNLSVPAGPFACFGYAVSGAAGIEAVEVRVDGGPWLPAVLATADELLAGQPELRQTLQFQRPEAFTYPFRAVWTLWRFDWEATPGRHLLEARARDRSGAVQPERDIDISDGINAYAAVRVEVST